MTSEAEVRPGLPVLPVATGAWVLLSSTLGYLVLETGPACNTAWDVEYRSLGQGAEAVCGGDVPFQVAFLAFVVTAFIALAALILGGGRTRRRAWRLCAGVAALPVLTFAVLRGITLVP